MILGAVALLLAGCQTPQQNMQSAQYVCQQSGLRPGTRAYANCIQAGYAQNQQASQNAANAVAVGAAAGLIGGALITESARPRYYYRGWGYCDAWGCY
jgi:hypothetical protein